MATVLKNKNFAFSLLATGIASDSSSLTVTTGDGVKFPATGNFRAVLWSASYTAPSLDINREIVTATFNGGNTFNIVRAVEGTIAKVWNSSDKIAHTITAGKIDELDNELNNHVADTSAHITTSQNTLLDNLTATYTQLNTVDTSSSISTQLGTIQSNFNTHTSDTSAHITTSQNTLLDNLTATYTQLNTVDTSSSISTQLGTKATLISPIFTTQITTPQIVGGSGTTQTLTYKTTTGVGATGADHIFLVGNNGATEAMRILNNRNIGIGISSPTSILHLKAGSATANTAPLQFTSGPVETTPRAGCVEFLTDAFYATITTGAARKTFAFLESPIFTTQITTPQIVGGSGTTQTLTYKTTTGVGATGADHIFLVGSNGATEAMRIFNNGKVNIGTRLIDPVKLLVLSGSGVGNSDLVFNDTSQGTDLKNFSISNRSQTLQFGTQNDTQDSFLGKMIIDRSGHVGIGTTPNVFLDILSGTANTAGDSLTSSTATITGPNVAMGGAGNHAGILNIDSNSTLGVDTGGSISLGGRYTGTAQAQYATIKGAKENATDNNYASYLAFGTRLDGAVIVEHMRINSSGQVGIGTTNPGVLLDLGTPGTTAGRIRIAGATSGYVDIGSSATPSNWLLTLPATGGANTYQLTTDGNGLCTWTAASSLRSMKNIHGIVLPEDGLSEILNTNIYRFNYLPGMATGDSTTEYVGVMADEAPWAMHHNGEIINPVNTLGYMVLGIQALNAKILALEQIINDQIAKHREQTY